MHRAPSNHSYIIGTRWIGVFTTALLLLMQQRPITYWWVWCIAVGLSTALSVAIQPVTRVCMRHPFLLSIDLVYGAGMVALTGGWTSPFYPFLLSLLMLPAIVRGLRGGVLAGAFASSLLAALFFLHGVWTTDHNPVLWQRILFLSGPLLCGYGFVRIGSVLASLRDTPVLHATAPTVVFPDWVGNMVRRTIPRLPQVFESFRVTRMYPYATTQNRSEALRIVLYAPLPQDLPLMQRIQRLTEAFEQTTHIAARCVVLGRPKTIQDIHCDSIRRIIIESLINVEQHAQASSVSVLVRFDDRTVTVVVQDDGTGLPDSGIRRAGLHSLQLLMYRVSEVGGRLDVFTTNGGGVAVRAAYPLSAEEVIA